MHISCYKKRLDLFCHKALEIQQTVNVLQNNLYEMEYFAK